MSSWMAALFSWWENQDKNGVQEPLRGHLRFLFVNLARHPASFTCSLLNAH